MLLRSTTTRLGVKSVDESKMAPARIDIALDAALAVGDGVFDDVFGVHGHRRARVLGDKENVVATLDALPFVVVADEDW